MIEDSTRRRWFARLKLAQQFQPSFKVLTAFKPELNAFQKPKSCVIPQTQKIDKLPTSGCGTQTVCDKPCLASTWKRKTELVASQRSKPKQSTRKSKYDWTLSLISQKKKHLRLDNEIPSKGLDLTGCIFTTNRTRIGRVPTLVPEKMMKNRDEVPRLRTQGRAETALEITQPCRFLCHSRYAKNDYHRVTKRD